MTSLNWDIQNLRKKTLAHVLKTICVQFHQNRLSRLGCRADRDRQKSLHPEHPGPKASKEIVHADLNKTGSYQPNLLIFRSKHRVQLGYIVSKFKVNLSKLTTARVPQTKKQNGRHDVIKIEISKIWEKGHLSMSSRLFVCNFIKIGSAV